MSTTSLRTLLLSTALVTAMAGAAFAADPVKIGLDTIGAGPISGVAKHMSDGFMLAIEMAGSKAGDIPVQIVPADDQAKPDIAVQELDRLVKREKVPIVAGFVMSNILQAVIKPATESKTFVVGTLGGPNPLSGADCSPYFFSVSAQNARYHGVAGAMAKQKGFSKVVTLTANYQAGKDGVAGFKAGFGGPVMDEIYVKLNEMDYTSEITRIAAAQPQVVYAFLPGDMAVNFIKLWNDSGLKKSIPLYTASTLTTANLAAVGEAAVGLNDAAFWSADLDVPANKTFVTAFKAKYRYEPSEFSAFGYDGANLILSAVAKVKGNTDDKDALRAAFKAADFASVRGNFKFGSNHFPVQDYFSTIIVRNADGTLSINKNEDVYKNVGDDAAKDCPMK